MNIKVGDKFKVFINSQDNEGLGVCKVNDFVIFVEFGLPNEELEIEITEVKKNYGRAKIVTIDKMSNVRIEAPCPYFYECGGCDIQHQTYDSQLAFKKHKVIMALEHIGGFKNLTISDVQNNNQFNYRNKVTLKVKDNNLGFYKRKTNDIIDINKCLISNEYINTAIEVLQSFIKEHNDNTFETIMIRYSNGLMIKIDAKNDLYVFELLSFLLSNIKLSSFWFNDKLISGSEYLEETIDDYTFKLLPTSFYQVNIDVMKRMYNKVVDYISKTDNNLILDLYCGVGTITSLVSKYAKRVVGVEENGEAIINAKENVLINKIDNIKFKKGKVENIINDYIDQKVDTIVIDPPRSGIGKKVIDALLKIMPQRIIYVSCNPATLARDLKELCNEKYEIIEVTPFDMFPQTSHVECVVKLNIK